MTGELRKFGLVVGGIFAAVAVYVLWRNDGALTLGVKVFGGIAAPLLLLGLAYPPALEPVYRGWMVLAHILGWINTRLILGFVFYGLFFPTRLILALMRKDPMHRRPDPRLATYWIDVAPAEVDPKSYEHPF